MNITKTDDKVFMEFSSILDYLEYAEDVPAENHSHRNSEEGITFSGGTWEDAVRQASTGNPELVQSFFEGVNVLNAMIEQEKVGEIRDVTGEYFDVADFLSGEPEVFRRDEYGDHRQVVPVYANFAMNCGISNKVIKNRGCGIIAMCDELCRSGFIVDLHLCDCCRYDKRYYTSIGVRLDPLDLDTAAFIIANPLCHRRLWFAVLEHVTDERNCGSYGYPDEFDTSSIFETGLSGFYFASSNHQVFDSKNYKTIEATKDHILAMLEKFKESAEQVILG